MSTFSRLVTVLATLLFCGLLAAQNEVPKVFDSEEQEARFKDLTLELRCLVCQNQNLADSDAPLAQQLRGEIYDMLQEGKSNEEITGFMVDRYGDFVLYSPPLQTNTLALWAFPMVILLIGGIVVFLSVRNRSRKLAATQKEGPA